MIYSKTRISKNKINVYNINNIIVLFRLFDYDNDGKVSEEDMLINFKLLLGQTLNQEQIKEIVDKTINEYSESEDKKFITYDEFIKILND